MAVLYGPPPKIIWLRCGNQTTDFVEQLFRGHAKALVVFEQDADAACWELY
jgi:predicted nuclease of predicted toxin-antitoxin system